MKDFILKFIYSNEAKGVFRLLLAIGMMTYSKTIVNDTDWKSTICGGAFALFGSALIDLGVVTVRKNTTTPPLAPDSKGDKEVKNV